VYRFRKSFNVSQVLKVQVEVRHVRKETDSTPTVVQVQDSSPTTLTKIQACVVVYHISNVRICHEFVSEFEF